jgi:hypothetical protein
MEFDSSAFIPTGQAKEINRVLLYGEPEHEGIDLSLLEHMGPIGWENVLLYGE